MPALTCQLTYPDACGTAGAWTRVFVASVGLISILLKVRHADQSQRAHDDIHRIIGQRQPVKLTETELSVWDTPPRAGEHVR